MIRQRGQFGILHDLRKAIERYTGFKVFLRSTDEGFSVTIDTGTDEDGPNIFLPKESGIVKDDLFNAAVGVLEDILKKYAA